MIMAPIILVTGANGFVGRHVVSALTQAGWHVRSAQRSVDSTSSTADLVTGLELGPSTNWQAALNGVQVVIHLAARAHRSKNIQERERDLYFSINVDGTLQLARSALSAGVQEFIFLSSVAVNGSTTDGRAPFCEDDVPAPNTVYGRTKAAAEQRLSELAANCTMSITAIRAPMIYGAGAVGNFGSLLSAVRFGVPLPFGLIRNRRAFLAIDNLISFIQHRLSASASSRFKIFLVADNEQVSTPNFIRELARASARPARLWPVPSVYSRAKLRLRTVPLSVLIDRIVKSEAIKLGAHSARKTFSHGQRALPSSCNCLTDIDFQRSNQGVS
jgi:UDP-glucose 4-epimerase